MAAIYTTLFWCALQVTLFLLLAAPIYFLVRRRSPQAATFAAATSLAAVIALSALAASPWPRWTLAFDGREGVAVAAGRPAAATGAREKQGAFKQPNANMPLAGGVAANVESPLAALWQAVKFAATPAASSPEEGTLAAERRPQWPALLAVLFLLGAAISGVRLAAGLIAVRRLQAGSQIIDDAAITAELRRLRQELRIVRPVSLLESTDIATPATVGSRRPAILLPPAWRTWDAVERRAILAHELAHISQHDFAACLIARAAIAVHFYHPLVRWFAGRLQLDQELAADAAAASLLGDRQQYLQTLASLALATPMHRLTGPARTFIPGRSLLVRRVEMLRTNAELRPTARSSSILRWAIAPILAAVAVIAGGLRPPATPAVRAAEPEITAAEKPQAASESGYVFSYVPNDFIFLVAIRPSEIATSSHLKPLAELMNETLRPKFKLEELQQMTFVVPIPVSDERGATIPGTGSEYTIFRTTAADVDFKPLIEATYGTTRTEEYKGKQLLVWGNPPGPGTIEFYSPVANTLISTPRAQLTPVIDNPKSAEPPAGANQWMAEAKGPMFGVVNIPNLKATFGGRSVSPLLPMFQPVFDLAEQATISVEDGDPLRFKASFACRNAEDGARVEQTLQAGLVIIKNVIATQRAQLSNTAPDSGSDMTPLFDLADQLMASVKTTVKDGSVNLTASVKNPSETIRRALIPQLWAARQAAARSQSMNNLKQLALAALIYANRFGAFPPAVVYGKSSYGDLNTSGDEAAPVPRSWRVELLPLLDQEALYKEYRLDQPWDSEANLAVLRKMPGLFRSPNDEATSTNASYFAVTGARTVFDGYEGTNLTEIEDGTSNTLLFVEAKRDVPWTKPEDLPYDPAQPVPALGGWRPDEFLIVLCDGSVLPVASHEGVGRNFLRPWIEKADGQVPPRLFPAAPAP